MGPIPPDRSLSTLVRQLRGALLYCWADSVRRSRKHSVSPPARKIVRVQKKRNRDRPTIFCAAHCWPATLPSFFARREISQLCYLYESVAHSSVLPVLVRLLVALHVRDPCPELLVGAVVGVLEAVGRRLGRSCSCSGVGTVVVHPGNSNSRRQNRTVL